MNLYALSLSLTSALSLLLGLFVLSKNFKNPTNATWGSACLLVSAWSACFVFVTMADSQIWGDRWARWMNIFAAYIPVLIAHFCSEIVQMKKRPGAIIWIGYALAICFTLLGPTDLFCNSAPIPGFKFYAKSGTIFPFYTAHFIFYCIYGLYILISRYSNCLPTKQNQIKYILSGLAVGYITGASAFLPVYGIQINLFPLHFVWLYAAIISYAILKHQLMDIKIVIQKTFFYTFWTLVLSIFYAAAIALIQGILSGSVLDPTEWRGLKFMVYRWSGALALITNSSLAVFAWIRNAQSKICKKFFFLSIFIGLWSVGSFLVNIIPDKSIALFVLKINYSFGVFVPALFLDFIYELGQRKKPTLLVGSGYLVSAILAVSLFSTQNFVAGLNLVPGYEFYISRPGPMYGFFVFYFCAYFFGAFVVLATAMKSALAERAAQQRYVLIAYLIGMAAGCEYFLSVYGRLGRPPLDDYILVVTFSILAYAISKHSLMDLRVVVRKTIFYSLLAFTISTAYVFIVFLAHKIFIGDIFTSRHLLASLTLILFITLLLRPVENYLRRSLDKKFFKGTIEEISQQNALLETELERRERLKSVGILAAGMAHEIKNPITAIKTFAEYLPKKYDDPDFRSKFSKLISEETERISGIVQDLLLFAKPSEPSIQECDVKPTLRGIVELLRPDLLRHSIEIEWGLGATKCLADPLQMKQAFLNILMNAMDAVKGKQGRRNIFIGAQRMGGYLEITLRDNGIGIPPDKIAHLFDPFYTDKEQGTGLGLAITHTIVSKNKGKIEVDSALGEGAVFRVLLPAA